MAIIIRPVRGQVTQQKFQPSRSMLRLAQATRQDYSGVGKVITNSLQVIQQHQEKLENERINNKVANSEVMFMAESEKALQKLKEKNTVFTLEETENQLIQFGNKMDGMFKELFKDDPKAAAKGKFYSEKAKLNYMTEQNKLRNNQILAETADRKNVTKNNIITQDFKKIKGNPANIDFENQLQASLKKFDADAAASIAAGVSRNEIEEDRKEIISTAYNRALIQRNPDGSINFELSLEYIKNNNVGGKEIPVKERLRIKDFVSDRMNEEAILEQRKDEREDIEMTNTIEKEFPNLTIDKIEQLKKNKGPKTVNYLNTVKEVLVNERKGIKTEVQLEDLNEINEMIINDRITNIDQKFSLSSDDLNEPQKSIAQRQKDLGLDNFADFKKTLYTQMSAEDKELEDEFKKFIKEIEPLIKGENSIAGFEGRLFTSKARLRRKARQFKEQGASIDDIFLNENSPFYLLREVPKEQVSPDFSIQESFNAFTGKKLQLPPTEIQKNPGESDEDFMQRYLESLK